MEKEKTNTGILGKIVYLTILAILLMGIVKLYQVCMKNQFNEFIKTEYIPYSSEFYRDEKESYEGKASYCIHSNQANDAMFYQTIELQPNTPYRVTCKVKTDQVKTQKEISKAGAQISIANTVEKSKSITGTTDWQELELIFNSKNRTKVEVGFRLGGYDDNCTGTAWFTDFKLEEGIALQDTNWNFACFIFTNTDVSIEKGNTKKQVSLTMTKKDIQDMEQNMKRFKTSCEELSHGKMQVSYDTFVIEEPITSLSYDEENGYYVGPENIQTILEPYLEQEEYDHIFIAVRLGDAGHQTDIPVYDWIGLGGMDYQGIGFSNIRLPNSERSYIYKYDKRVNTFPEEVFIHEFLHSLERNAKEYGLERPELHDYATYGYQDEKLIGLKKWYEDYMNCEIKTNQTKIGLDPKVYQLKPNHRKDFEFSTELKGFEEPQNLLEELKMLFRHAIININQMQTQRSE